ncbi:MAG: hypothetical protein ACLTFJ_11365 [Clostridium sp.]
MKTKMDACVELVRQAVTVDMVLLFSQFTSVLDEIEKALAKRKSRITELMEACRRAEDPACGFL